MFAGGVDVASDVEPVLGGVLTGEAAGYLLLGFQGADAPLADVVGGPDRGVFAEAGHVGGAVPAEFEQVTAGVLGGGVLRSGDAGDAGQAGQDGVAELPQRRLRYARGDRGLAGVAGGVPGADQAAQCPLGLDGPDGSGVALGGVLVVAEYVSVMPISA